MPTLDASPSSAHCSFEKRRQMQVVVPQCHGQNAGAEILRRCSLRQECTFTSGLFRDKSL